MRPGRQHLGLGLGDGDGLAVIVETGEELAPLPPFRSSCTSTSATVPEAQLKSA